jgi:hypothetical protein
MKTLAAVLSLVLLAGTAVRGEACGDKFLRVGRGARYQRGYVAVHPACILLYADPRSPVSPALRELESALRRAGHRATIVEAPAGVTPALSTGHYNIIVAGLEDLAVVQAEAKKSAMRIDVLPMLHQPSPAARRAAEKDFRCVAEAPGRKMDILAEIDDLMEIAQKGEHNRKAP